jgi:integrase
MLRHFSLIKEPYESGTRFRLRGPDGNALRSFDIFIQTLKRRAAQNTQLVYPRALAEFIDYSYDAVLLQRRESKRFHLTQTALSDVVESYHEYLVYGKKSGNRIAKLVAKVRPSPMNAVGTSAVKHAALRYFLKLSNRLGKEMAELVESGVKGFELVQQDGLLWVGPELVDRERPTRPQRAGLTANSMMAAVIAGSARQLPRALGPSVSFEAYFDEERMFPLPDIARFINASSSARDRAYHALLAACGCRAHEALQLLWEDIDMKTAAVQLVSPDRRAHHPSYLTLLPDERAQLAWKGRATSSTVMLEPFRSMFFDALVDYRKHEYDHSVADGFVFQYFRPARLTTSAQVRPYFLSAHSSRSETFHRTCRRSGIAAPVHGVHAFRHSYATYALNYFPRPDGSFGLPIAEVQQLLGHAQLKDTKKYARLDRDLIEAELEYSNNYIFGAGTPKSVRQLKLAAMEAQVERLKKEIAAAETAQ